MKISQKGISAYLSDLPRLPRLDNMTNTKKKGRQPEHRVRLSLSPDEINEILEQISESPLWHKLRAAQLRKAAS